MTKKLTNLEFIDKCRLVHGNTYYYNLVNYIKYSAKVIILCHIHGDCRNKYPLPFDRYIPEHNLLIEYDGEQHYISSSFYGGMEGLCYRQKNDTIKTNYCISNNINLIRIKYDEEPLNKLKNFFIKIKA